MAPLTPTLSLLSTVWLAACVASSAPSAGRAVRFAPEAPAIGQVPFPSELFRSDDGRIALGPLPNPKDGAPVFDALRGLLADRGGFCGTCAIRFGIDGAPPELPAALTGAYDDPVQLIDLATGAHVPLDLAWDDDLRELVARPSPGWVALAGHPHAAFVTADLADAAPAFVRARDGSADADPRARAALGPALDTLEALGVPRDEVSGLAAFTPEDPTVDRRAIVDAIAARPPARAVVDSVYTGAALDDLLGVSVDDRPGIDAPSVVPGEHAIRHATTAVVVTGTFPAARFVEGAGTDLGAVVRGPDGLPRSAVDDEVPFVLIVPEGADVSRLPVVVAHHGFNASRTTAFGLADTAGALGWAVLGIDAYQHGARARSAVDEVHAMRGGTPGPDGFAETSSLDVTGRVFGLFGTPPELAVAADYPLAAFTQFAADVSSALRLVDDGDWSAVAAADPALAGLGFDPHRRVYFGNSMGAVVGTQVVAVGQAVDGAILDVLPGGIIDTLCASGEFRPLSESLLLPAIGVDGGFDEVTSQMALDVTVDLYRWALEPVDPLALAPYLGRGDGPDLRIQLAGHDEVAAPAASEAVVAAAGIPGFGAFRYAPVAEATGIPDRSAERWDGAMHQMFELAAQASVWEEPLVQPLVARPDDVVVVNPIDEVHADIAAFLARLSDGGADAR